MTTQYRSPWAGDGESWSAQVGPVQVTFCPGGIDVLGELARSWKYRRVLVVTDPGVRASGHVDRAVAGIEKAGLAVAVFDRVGENPTSLHVEDGRAFAIRFKPDLIVGLGGGSAMDAAKGINFVLTNGGRMESYWGKDMARRPLLPAIGVPTTAGTGSEAQSAALISHPETHRKMACRDEKARFFEVFLDPELVTTTPRHVAAAAGIDAVSHAVESFVSRRRNPVSQMLSHEAWRLLDGNLESYLANPGDLRMAGNVLLGSHLAGAAIEASMLGATHAAANPLTARFGLAHGVAIALMLPPVIRFNALDVGDLYQELHDRLPERIEEMRAAGGLPRCLRDCGVEEEQLPSLAEEAVVEWTAHFNPRPVTPGDLLRLYREAYVGGGR